MNEPTPAPPRIPGCTGPRGIKVGDYEHPVFDGPQPRTQPVPVKQPHGLKLNTEADE